jgi:pyrroline-5-carboxylate reductase
MTTTGTQIELQEILLVGCGNMGFALLEGWLKKMPALRAHVIEPAEALRDRAAAAGALVYEKASDLPAAAKPQAILVAVKPQYVTTVLEDFRELATNGAMVLSVAAGVTINTMEKAIGAPAAIVRCMPNTPASIGAGALVCCPNASSGAKEETLARLLLEASGDVHFVSDEALMDAVTAISGSGPAYVFNFIENLVAAGINAGLPAELAHALAVQTAYGASLLAKTSDTAPGKLREQVTSPNGTTFAALNVLMRPDGLPGLLNEAVEAAKSRSIELGRA